MKQRLAAGAYLQAVYARALDEIVTDIPDLRLAIERVERELATLASAQCRITGLSEHERRTRQLLRDVLDLLHHLKRRNTRAW